MVNRCSVVKRRNPKNKTKTKTKTKRINQTGGLPKVILLNTLEEHKDFVYAVAFHPTANPPLLATCSSDNTAKLWRFSPDNSTVNCVATLNKSNGGHSSPVMSVAFHPTANPSLLATCSMDYTAKLWLLSSDNSSATCVATLQEKGSIFSVAFHPTELLMATSGSGRRVILWRITPDYSTKILSVLGTNGWKDEITSIAFYKYLMATGSSNAKLWWVDKNPPYAWGTEDMLGNATLLMHGRSVNSVAFHPTANPPLLATGSSDKTVKLWSFVNIRGAMRTKDLATLEGHSKSVNCVSFHPTAPFLATCSDDNTVKLWMLVALNSTPAIVICVATLRGNSIVNSVAFHPTAPLMASSADNTVKLWNFEQFTIMWQRMLVLHRMSGMTRTLTTRLGIDPRHSEPGSQLIKNLSRKVESKLQRNIVDFFADHPPTQLKQLQEMILRRSLTTPKRHNKQKQLTLVSPVVLDDH